MRMNKGECGSRGAERGVRRGAAVALLAGTALTGVVSPAASADPGSDVPASVAQSGTGAPGSASTPLDGVFGVGSRATSSAGDAAALLVFGGTRAETFATRLISQGREGTAPTARSNAAETDGLDPLLATAYDMAAAEAHAQGVPLSITSGYRSPGEQQAMWENGIATYGSPDAARRWVLPPEESTHVTGQAIDVGPQAGAAWLEANGNRWGLCRMYDNEWWHFEIATLPGAVCPPRLPDASQR